MTAKPFRLTDTFSDPELAVTKEQHDEIVGKRGRNYTDGPIARRRDYGARPTDSNPGDDNARRIREDGGT